MSEKKSPDDLDIENFIDRENKKIEDEQNASKRGAHIFHEEKEHGFSVKSSSIGPKEEEIEAKKDTAEKADIQEKKRSRGERTKTLLRERLLMRKKLLFTLVPLFFIAILVISVTVQIAILAGIESQKSKYIEEADSIHLNMQTRMDEVNDEYVTDKILKILSQNDLYVYTNSLWKYTLTVNGAPVDDMQIKADPDVSPMVIILTEKGEDNPLPAKVRNVGTVTRGDKQDDMTRHISVKAGGSEISPNVSVEGLESVYEFTLDNISEGESVVITLSDQLGAKLGIPFNEIAVDISK